MSDGNKKVFGILTSGGDAPGLNAAIRGVARTAIERFDMRVMGIREGYRGLIDGNCYELFDADFSGILSRGGTILGTSREKPFKNKTIDIETGKTAVEKIKSNYRKWGLDALVVLGGNGTMTTANLLAEEGLNIIGVPKTIDNDIAETDISFGFHSAMSVATDAIDRIHTTAHSHNRMMIVEVMGHKAGWLALYAGLAGGGDVILIPEIPYNAEYVAKYILERKKAGKQFSIVVVAEGAMTEEEAKLEKKEFKRKRKEMVGSIGYRLASELSLITDIEPRVTVLGYIQRGGTPAPYDRTLATELGAFAANMLATERYGEMVAIQGGRILGVPLHKVAGKTKKVPLDHPMMQAAKDVCTCMGNSF